MADEPIRDQQQRDVREEINRVRKIVDDAQQKPVLDYREILLLLGHIVSVLDSEWGTMMRILQRQQAHHDLLMGRNEDSLTLSNLYREALLRKRLNRCILAMVLALSIGTLWLVVQGHKRDQKIDAILNK